MWQNDIINGINYLYCDKDSTNDTYFWIYINWELSIFMTENKQNMKMDFTHSYENENHETFVNTIDHFLVLERSVNIINDAGVLHSVVLITCQIMSLSFPS